MTIRSRPSTDTYREGYDRIFGKEDWGVVCGVTVAPTRAMCMLDAGHAGPHRIFKPTESLDSHPAAD